MSEAQEQAVSREAFASPVLLRQARESAGLHIAALAAALKVPVKKLEALEAGRYEELPDLTFARALASSACRHLKIDATPVLAQIPQARHAELGDSPQAINEPFRTPVAGLSFNPAGWLSRPAVLGALALLVGAVVLMFLPSQPVSMALQSPASSGVNEPGAALAPVLAAATSLGMASAPVADPPSSQPPVSVAPATDATASGAPPVAAGAADVLLSIAATGDSWVEVLNGSGAVVVQRMLKQGDVLDFSTAPPYSVVLGRADSAKVTVRGQPFDLAPYARNSVARFEVK